MCMHHFAFAMKLLNYFIDKLTFYLPANIIHAHFIQHSILLAIIHHLQVLFVYKNDTKKLKNYSALPASACVLTNGTNAKGCKSCKKQLVKEAINIFLKGYK